MKDNPQVVGQNVDVFLHVDDPYQKCGKVIEGIQAGRGIICARGEESKGVVMCSKCAGMRVYRILHCARAVGDGFCQIYSTLYLIRRTFAEVSTRSPFYRLYLTAAIPFLVEIV